MFYCTDDLGKGVDGEIAWYHTIRKGSTCRFAAVDQLRHICDGEFNLDGQRYIYNTSYNKQLIFSLLLYMNTCRCGESLKMFSTPTVQHFINCVPMSEAQSKPFINQKGMLNGVCI